MRSRPTLWTIRVLAASLAALVFTGSLASTTPAFAGFNSPGDFDRALVMKRARDWYVNSPRYSQSRFYNGYRTDCSGYVSMAWGLKRSLTTWTLPSVAWRITKSDLKAGDVMLDYTGPSKHVVIFDQWANKEQTAYWEYELAGGTGKVVHRVVPYPFWTRDRDQYKPYRFAKSPEYSGKQPPKPAVKPAVAPAPAATPTADASPTPKPGRVAEESTRKEAKRRAGSTGKTERASDRRERPGLEPKPAPQEQSVLQMPVPRPESKPATAGESRATEGLSEPVAVALVRGLVAWIAK